MNGLVHLGWTKVGQTYCQLATLQLRAYQASVPALKVRRAAVSLFRYCFRAGSIGNAT